MRKKNPDLAEYDANCSLYATVDDDLYELSVATESKLLIAHKERFSYLLCVLWLVSNDVLQEPKLPKRDSAANCANSK
jgi:hypothetical protein